MLKPRLPWGVCVVVPPFFHITFQTASSILHITCTPIPLYPVVGRHALVAVLAWAAVVAVAPGYDTAHKEEEATDDTKHGSHSRAVAHM